MPVKKSFDSEKYLESLLVLEAKKRKGLCIKLLPFIFAGLPDRMMLLPGGYIKFIEVKSVGCEPSPIQKQVHKTLKRLGFEVLIIDSYKSFQEYVDTI